ncbi:Lrp/AsnC family transcriptional regulator [Streptomyces tsukubensis]|uniref:AsnC family transcriptional regulator n=1 Tax=Streptomyces tsukubensis TaxID=83656 RepID=A0A1V3ZZJ1_9ACTN|nr:Lrp/AsnC family transcriptional regulator [Streptomyces tsukubensis]OON71924.1 AsnC family transcriptional regulator [Streptomyces tsukubensis]QFR96871.1 AsnC family transcriptional regulator [Streptomyces tsukubensis]
MNRRVSAIDDLDRRVIAALQLNGRAPWNAVARWVDASETTAQRRYRALREQGLLRVVGTQELARTREGVSMYVRVQAKPGRGLDAAEQFVASENVRFVAVVTGTADLIVDIVTRDNDEMTRMLFTDLPAADLITSREVLPLIRAFRSASMWDTGLLPRGAAEDLRPAPLTTSCDRADWDRAPQALSTLEQSVIAALKEDGRTPVSTLARSLDASESSVARAMERLTSRGILQFRTLVEPALLGYDVEFMVWVSVEPGHLDAAGRQLARHPGVKSLSAATGRFNLVGHMVLPHRRDLYRFTSDVLGTLPGVLTSDVTLHLATLKYSWHRMSHSV